MNETIENAIGDMLFWRNALTELKCGKSMPVPFTEAHAKERLDSATRKLTLAIEAFGNVHKGTAKNIEIVALTWNLYQDGKITFDHHNNAHFSPSAARQLGELITSTDLISYPFQESLAFKSIYNEHMKRVRSSVKLSAVH